MMVCILLSTYNGEKYLHEQLDSLLKQEDVELHILVRDDGSIDNTTEILSSYKEKYPSKFTLIFSENIGWQRSFLELMRIAQEQYSTCNYYAFCDQDDIWLPKKLSQAVKQLNTLKTNIRLYCSNLYYYKDATNYGLIKKKTFTPTVENCLIRNYATGCTCVFNRALLVLAVMHLPKQKIPHDLWVYQTAVLFGSVYVDNNAYIMYRQHQNNQIGNKKSWQEIWTRRLKGLFSTTEKHVREQQADELINCFSDILPYKHLKAIQKVAYYRKNLFSRLSLIFDYRYSTGHISNDFWLKLRILAGKL